jgi:hypothetical protein
MPESIWGVIVGSLLTLLGVRLQLQSEARHRERDRKMQLRRDVFLQALEGVAGTQQFFFRFANPAIAVDKIDTSSGNAGWLNKLHAVATFETIKAFSRADAALGKSVFDLLARRVILDSIDEEITTTRGQLEWYGRFQNQVREGFEIFIRQPDIDASRISQHAGAAAQAIQESHDQVQDLDRQLDEQIVRRRAVHRDLIEAALRYYVGYQVYLRSALVALRNELDLPIDAHEYELLGAQNAADMRSTFDQFLDHVDNVTSSKTPAA